MAYTPGAYHKSLSKPPLASANRYFSFEQSGYKQPRPINRSLVLPYLRKHIAVDTQYSITGKDQDYSLSAFFYDYEDWLGPRAVSRTAMLDATNKARERFIDKMYSVAEVGITVATSRLAIDMITKRAIQLRRGLSYLRRGQLRKFLKEFGIAPLPKHKRTLRTRPKDFSGLWLEYWFGWTPLISDIYAAVDVLQSEFPDDFVFSTGKQTVQFKDTFELYEVQFRKATFTTSCRIQANVKVRNPNLYKANQLGVINPAVVVWDVIPFSFVVDWFIPVGNFLRSLSEFAGLELENAQHYQKLFLAGSCSTFNRKVDGTLLWKTADSIVSMKRNLGIPQYTPRAHIKLPSATRAATAISLLVQLFIKP